MDRIPPKRGLHKTITTECMHFSVLHWRADPDQSPLSEEGEWLKMLTALLGRVYTDLGLINIFLQSTFCNNQ